MSNQSDFVIAFKGNDTSGSRRRGIQDILGRYRSRMISKPIAVTPDIVKRMDLNNYASVCQFSLRIKRCIEGYGFNPDYNYDEEGKSWQDENHQDKSKLIDRNHRMPPGAPLDHAYINLFNQWIEAGMPEEEGGSPYDKGHGRIWPLPETFDRPTENFS